MNNSKPTRLKFDRYYHAELFATQGDTGRTFALEILDDYNKPMNLTGATLRLYVAAGDEVTYADGTIDDAEKGKASVTLYNSQLKFPGKQKAQFVLTGADGHKIGSKIFDLYVEKELAAGPTLGKNLYVDFEAVEKTLRLIESYDKTLEDGRELNLALNTTITEGVDTRAALTACKEKALKIKSELEDKTVAGTREKDALEATNATAAGLREDLTRENRVAANNFANLTDKITAGGKTAEGLTQATNAAGAADAILKTTTQTATAAEKELKETNTAAEATRKNLSAANETGGTLSAELSKKISTGETLKGALDSSTAAAGDKKSALDNTIKTAETRESTLKAADTEAKGTEALIRELMERLDATKGEVNAIIASGDLGKYVTDPVLEERLKSYVTKEAMQKTADAINTAVGEKADKSKIPDLSPYAKTEDIKTHLADMEEDSEHRTVTDAEKKAWSEGGGIDKQYLYDILMGESLITRKEGEWPVVHGKPTKIDESMFKGAHLASVTIPSSIKTINGRAFEENQLTSVVIPSGVTAIGSNAFFKNKLTSVVIPPSVTFIGPGAFADNQLTSVVIPPGVISLQWYIFSGNRLTSVVIPPSVTEIEDGVFMDNQLMSVVIPPSVKSIEEEAFAKNKLSEVKVPQNCTVADGAFDAGVNIIRY